MTWTGHHAESERLAMGAQSAARTGDRQQALRLYREAAEAEKRALDELDVSKTRTRGITSVSAVALYYKAEEFNCAEQLAHLTLSAPDIPEFARADMRTLVQAIWTESAKRQAGVAFAPGQVMVSVKGGEVVAGGAPLDLIVDRVQTIQSLFFRTIEWAKGLPHRKGGRPTRDIQDQCRPWLFQSAPGSYQFSVAVQNSVQPDLFSPDVEPDDVAKRFMEIVGASAADDAAALERLVPDRAYRTTFLRLTRNLTPTGKAYERVELRAAGETRPVALGSESREYINKQIRATPATSTAPGDTEMELRGVLRAVDLDHDWMDVLVDGTSIHVVALQDTVDDVIGPMVNRPVVTKVLRTSTGKHKYLDIELDE